MGAGGAESREGVAQERRVVYCLVPADLADQLHELLRFEYAELPDVEVVVERRSGEDRRKRSQQGLAADAATLAKKAGDLNGDVGDDLEGRRVGERRAHQVAIEPLPLPRRARRHSRRLVFVERVEPATLGREDEDTAGLVARFKAGDADAFSRIYRRYYERVYAYLRVALRDSHEAEDITQQVFISVFQKIGKYERRSQPFRSWLFRITRNAAISQLRKAGRLESTDPVALAEQLADEPASGDLDPVLDWITDRDLSVLVERLPLPQRQALILRFSFGMNSTEAARVLGRKSSDVRMLQHRALEYLRLRLGASRVAAAANRADSRRRDRGLTRPVRRADVMRARRYVLR